MINNNDASENDQDAPSNKITGISINELSLSTPTGPTFSSTQTETQAQFLKDLEVTKRGRQLAIPTEDGIIRKWLRHLNEPITLFGEGPYDRRERLRRLLALNPVIHRELLATEQKEMTKISDLGAQVPDTEEFFVPGPVELIKWRKWLVNWSLLRARDRLKREQAFYYDQSLAELQQRREELVRRVARLAPVGSQVSGERPLSAISVIPGTRSPWVMATGDFGGSIKLWTVDQNMNINPTSPLEEGIHSGRVTSLAFDPTGQLMASADVDGVLGLWKNSTHTTENFISLQRILGHTARIGAVNFHPSGKLLGSASYDSSWRLWDVETATTSRLDTKITELQIQEGHSRPVTALTFHPDGALAITGGLDTYGRVWDLRWGRAIWTLQGHLKSIITVACHPLRPWIMTAGEEGIVRVWDLRNLRPIYQLPAHPSVISQIEYTGVDDNGELFLTAGYDGSIRVWSTADYRPVCLPLTLHEGKVMGAAFLSPTTIVSVGQDRTLKVWSSPSSLS